MRIRWVVSSLILLGIAFAAAQLAPRPSVQAQSLQISCRDPRGCPDLTIDAAKLNQWHVDFIDFGASDCAVVEGCVNSTGPRLLLRFTYNTPNIGAGDLIIGDPTAPENAVFFEFSSCHGHPHFTEYADYRLWTPAGYQQWQALRAAADPDALANDLLAANPAIAAQMLEGRKQGFCVIDLLPHNTPGAGNLRPGQPKYFSCRRNQGISNGYADEYGFGLDCQWLDVTSVAPGKYILEAEANAERQFAESNYANNSGAVEVTLPDRVGRGPRAQLVPKKFVPSGAGCCATPSVAAGQ